MKPNTQQSAAAAAEPAIVAAGPSNLVAAGIVVATTKPTVPRFGTVQLARAAMSVSDRYGRSVIAVTARVPLSSTGLSAVIAVYGRLNDKTGKITYEPSVSAKVFDSDGDAKDQLKAHIIGALKAWPEWSAVRIAADKACRTGKVKATGKAADGSVVELETSLESDDAPEPVKSPAAEPAGLETAL